MVENTPPSPLGLNLAYVFSITLRLAPPRLFGGSDRGPARAAVGIAGGIVAGPRLAGRVLPVCGGEWAYLGPGPRIRFDARYMIEAEDGATILIENLGLRWSSPEVEARLRSGEIVPPDDYYMVASPRFEVAEGPHDWLNRTVIVGRGQRIEGGNRIDYYAVENG